MRFPWTIYMEWRSRERLLDRQLLHDAVDALREAFKSQGAQANAFKAFLDGFITPNVPKRRDWDEDEDDARYVQQRMNKPATLAEMQGILEKLDAFGLDD